jgi:PAS domain S-box-containing protein
LKPKVLEKIGSEIINDIFSFNEIKEGWVWNINYDDEFTFISPRVINILGYEPKEMLFKKIYDFITGHEAESIMRLLNSARIKKESYWDIKISMKKKNGETIMVVLYALAILDKNKNVCGYEGIAYTR